MSQIAALASLLLYALNLSLFLLPGFALLLTIAARRKLCATQAIILVIVASAALGYIAFWAYFGSRLLGRAFSYAVVGASIVALVTRRKPQPEVRAQPDIRALRGMAAPFLYAAAVGACYTCLLFLFKDPFTTGVGFANDRFFSEVRPGDNQIPLIFAERIYAQKPLEPFCCGDWRSSDRPPLQAGILLLERPLKAFGNIRLNYQLLATGLQCLWICGVWVVLEALRAPPQRIKQALGFLVFSGFLFYNSVYVWPKLLAASFVLFTFGIVLDVWITRRTITWFETVLGAASFALAMLAHPGSIFSAPALVLLVLTRRALFDARKLLASAGLIALFLAPWIAYQKLYDPPGNRLLKMHLAGVGPIDSRSTWQAVRDTYRIIGFRKAAEYKWVNLHTLIGPHPFLIGPSEASRAAQREYLWNALGVLNAGWLAALLLFRKRTPALPHSGLLIGAAALNLLIWCIILIGPAYTLTEHGSYADFLLLSVGLLGFLLLFPRIVVLFLFALQVLSLFLVWVFVKPALIAAAQLQIPLLVLGVIGTTALAWHFGRSYFAPVDTSFSKCFAKISTSKLTRDPAE